MDHTPFKKTKKAILIKNKSLMLIKKNSTSRKKILHTDTNIVGVTNVNEDKILLLIILSQVL